LPLYTVLRRGRRHRRNEFRAPFREPFGGGLEAILFTPEDEMNVPRALPSDGNAMAVGSLAGFVAGTGLGAGIVFMLGTFSIGIALIVILHTSVAMMLMGGWTAPSLLPRDE
jgi:hypothetical protein